MTKGAIIDLSAEFCPMQTDGASTLKTYNLFLVAHIFSFFVFLKKKKSISSILSPSKAPLFCLL